MDKLFIIVQAGAMAALSPLVSGFITKIKNNLRLRKGQSVFQPYYNLMKLAGKGETVSENASWIFKAAPCVVFASSLAAVFLVPFLAPGADILGDSLALIFVFALGRFFMALAALDTGSSFGGMGSSRDMFISSFAEPAVCMAFFAAALKAKTTVISAMGQAWPLSLSTLGACAAIFLVALAETSRVPVDNQETHLELTMIHEAMLLEYSGRKLALIEFSCALKQMVWLGLICHLMFPVMMPAVTPAALAAVLSLFLLKVSCLAILIACIEVAVAKMRLFRAPDYLGFAFVIAGLSAAAALFGI